MIKFVIQFLRKNYRSDPCADGDTVTCRSGAGRPPPGRPTTTMSDISDEEIDSEGVVSGYSDDDFGMGGDVGEEGILLSDLLGANLKKDAPPAGPSEQVKKHDITARAALLRKGGSKDPTLDHGALDPLLHSDSDSDDSDDSDDAALQDVVFAATGRDLSQREARKAAVNVEQGVGEENPLSAPVGASRSGGETMDKLLNALEGTGHSNLTTLKKRVARLEKDGKKALDAPLPDVVTGRIERAAAYKKTTTDISEKWGEVVKTNRRAATLSFPLGEPKASAPHNTADVVAGFKPDNDFENEIEKLLREGGVSDEKDVVEQEEQELKGRLSKEEFLARRRELAKMRSLMFQYERKMKRISKIKSKKFRRIMKNEKLKLKEERGDMSGSDVEDVAAGRIAAEKRRAEERMTLRHKNTSKWVKRQLSRGETKRNPEARAAVEEQLRLHDELRRRQEGVMELSDSEKGESGRELSDVGSDVEAMDGELERMKTEIEDDGKKKGKAGKTGIMGMKFMQAAAERERKDALKLLEEMGSDEEEGLDEYGSDKETKAKGPSGPVGRRSFSGTTEPAKEAKSKRNSENDGEGVGLGIDDSDEEGEALDKRIREEYDEDATALGEGAAVRSVPVASLESLVREGNNAPSGFVTRLNGRLSANVEKSCELNVTSGVVEAEEANVVTETYGTTTGESPDGGAGDSKTTAKSPGSKKRVRFSKDYKTSQRNGTQSSVVPVAKHNEVGVADIEMSKSTGTDDKATTSGKSSRKRKAGDASSAEEKDRARMQLVARAFAGLGGADEAEFEASKAAEIEQEIDAETSANATKALPGWGSWEGAGAKKKRRKSAFAEAAQRKLEEARARAIQKRPDKNHGHLQLNSKRSKDASKLTLAAVPFPFRSRAEWEREVSVPIVKEVTASRAFRGSIRERVETKKGAVIQPIQEGQTVTRARKEGTARGKKGVLQRRQHAAKAREGKRKAFHT